MKVEYINHYLTDNDVANFARQSFGKLAKNFTNTQNENLIKFLARGMSSGDWDDLIHELMSFSSNSNAHDMAVYIRSIPEHWVPFGHPQISLRVSAPVPIARQMFKHKIGFVESEESRRYIKSEPQFFVPDYFRKAALNVKQGSLDEPHENNQYWLENYLATCQYGLDNYMGAIESGVCPEQARFFLPQGTEVNWSWTGSLYAYANVYNQRSGTHAQKESQILAEQLDKIIAPLFPISWAALTGGEY